MNHSDTKRKQLTEFHTANVAPDLCEQLLAWRLLIGWL